MDIDMAKKLLNKFDKGLIVLDDKEEIILADSYAKKICGNNTIEGKTFGEIFHVDLDKMMDQPQIIKTISGNKFSFLAQHMAEKNQVYIVVRIQEITDWESPDSRLYIFEQMMDSLNDGILISNYEGRIVLYNRAMEEMEGLSGEAVVGKYLWEAYNYNPELSEHRSVYKTGNPLINRYRAHNYKDGRPQYVSYNTYPIKKGGEVIGVYSVSKNETSLQSLLSETIDLKRKLFSKSNLGTKELYENGTKYTFADIAGESTEIKNVIHEAECMALLDSTILIIGETGTGKEVFAQSMHNFGKSQKKPFIATNCAAIPENLLESILFGTVKGAYTGAVNQVGLFEAAQGGTLFLDEINSMSPSLQSKILRALQEKNIRRVGGVQTIPVQCRVICAINEDPQKLIEKGTLRQDLFYRIAELCLFLSPLRERPEDLRPLSELFVERFNHLLNKSIKNFSAELWDLFFSYQWPGNVRELEHLIQSLMVRAKEDQTELGIYDMPVYLREIIFKKKAPAPINRTKITLPEALRDLERKMILDSLNKKQWNLTEAAKDLGIIRQSLQYRLKKLGIEAPE